MQYRKDIQIFRGIAVLLVFFYHLNLIIFKNGYLGVDIFFVISGFIMGKLYLKCNTINFYKARFKRLFPAYILVTVSVLIIYFPIIISPDFSQLVEQSFFSIFYLSNFHFWKMGSYFNQVQFNPLLHFWSLSVEVQFYLLVPLIFPLLRKSIFFYITLFSMSFLLCIFLLGISPKTSFYMFPTRFWEFLIGAGIAWLPPSNNFRFLEKHTNFFRILATLLVLFILFLWPIQADQTDYLMGHPALPCLFITVSFGFMLYLGIGRRLEENIVGNILVFIGNISYSIYLVHFPVIIILNYEPLSGTIIGFNSNLDLFFICILTLLLSYLLWTYVEKSEYRINGSWFSLSLLMPITAVIAFGLNVAHWSNQKQPMKNILLAMGDRSKEYRCPTINRIINPASAICPMTAKKFTNNILLIGDSHADSIKDSLAKINLDMNSGTFFSVNPPLVKNSTYQIERLKKDIELLKPKALIIHYYHEHYNSSEFREKLVSLLKFSKDLNIFVYVIAPIPTYKKSILSYLYERIHRGQKINFNLISKREYYENIEEYLNFASEQKEYIESIYNPGNIFCKKEYCEFMSKDFKPYYFDDDHLTLSGAKKLEPFFKSIADDLKFK